MDSIKAIQIVEGFIDYESQEQYLEAWQYLVNTGMAWQLQGWYGRCAQQLIADGLIWEA